MTRATRAAVLAAILALACAASTSFAATNVILMIGDGMGYQHVDAGSYYLAGQAGQLAFEPYYKCGVKTRSLNITPTDSAAAATALATGVRVYNGTLSQTVLGTPYTTILEKAQAMGKSTGLVTTVPITHATPAAFGAHEGNRDNYPAIGNDYLNASRPDVLFGAGDPARGGAGYFSASQVTTAQSLGYQVAYDKAQMDALNPANRALGLFQGGQLTYEYDRLPSNTEPHLRDMAAKALQLLEDDSDGFFLMIEGGSIDYASHANDINRMTREVVEFHNSVAAVLDWMQGRNDTLLIVTADHETGGLTATSQGTGLYPTAAWNTGDHTAANVPLYITGANADLVNQYVVNGAINNTDVFRVMDKAFVTPVPEPASCLALLGGMAGFAISRKKRK